MYELLYYRKTLIALVFILAPVLAFFISAPLAHSALININTADSEELQTLTGIGPTYAQRIIDYRTLNGPFQTIEEIKNVSGIGEVTFSNIKDFITVGTIQEEEPSSDDANSPNISQQSTSSHYSATPITNLEPDVIEIGAGGDRVGVAGSPMEFKVVTNGSIGRNDIYTWNFGDGYIGGGSVLNHVYEYPGEYVVVLKAQLPRGEAISRANVRIVDSELYITKADSKRIEITNSSNYEVNLFGRALFSGNHTFIFPQDTIIKSGRSISFSNKITGINPLMAKSTKLIVVGDSISGDALREKVKERRLDIEDEIREEIYSLDLQRRVLIEQQSVPRDNLVVKENDTESEAEVGGISEDKVVQTATAISSISDDKSKENHNWWSLLKNFFLRTR